VINAAMWSNAGTMIRRNKNGRNWKKIPFQSPFVHYESHMK
jgi:hypothetical protein